MVYKRYEKRNGKLYGPYYYESYRDGNKIRKRYLGQTLPETSSTNYSSFLLPIILIGIVAVFFFGLIHYNLTGKSVVDESSATTVSSDSGASDSGASSSTPSDTSSSSEAGSSSSQSTQNDLGGGSTSPPSESTGSPEAGSGNVEETPQTPTEPPAETPTETPQNPAEQTGNESQEIPQEPEQPPITAENQTTNETISNETNIENPANESEQANETEINQTISNETLTNETTFNETAANESIVSNVTSSNISIITARGRIKLGEPVKWTKNVSVEVGAGEVKIELPASAENVSVTKVEVSGNPEENDSGNNSEEITNESEQQIVQEGRDSVTITGGIVFDVSSGRGLLGWIEYLINNLVMEMTGRAVDVSENTGNVEVTINDNATQYTIEYETPAPTSEETEIPNGKQIIISAPDELNYTDVLAYTYLTEEANANNIRLYHIVNGTKESVDFDSFDENGNGLIDYVEWNVPHLSNQTYELIIEISKAEELDENRIFVRDIYNEVKAQDDVWANISDGHYVRVTFNKELTNGNDITLFARSSANESENGSASIEVYLKDSDEKIAEIDGISGDGLYKTYLTGINESSADFDLRIVGNVEIDYIVDPDVAPVITYDGAYTIYTFNANGTFSPPAGVASVVVLVVAGGGGGGTAYNAGSSAGGGGGAGGLIYNSSYPVSGSVSIVIGNGGNGGRSNSASYGDSGANGDNSSFGTLVAVGGGGGAGYSNQSGSGGSSGGGDGWDGGALAPGKPVAGQGYMGGYSYIAGTNYGGGGGGGSNMTGQNGTSGINGAGGNGLNYSINGSNSYYAGGGGCGGHISISTAGAGGLGGGGAGGNNGVNGNNGTANSGGGGGGGGSTHFGGAGGSGIVIVRFLTPSPAGLSSNSSGDEWRMLGRDLEHTYYDGTGAPSSISNSNVASFSVPGGGYLTPVAVANGYVYFANRAPFGSTTVYQLNATTMQKVNSNTITSMEHNSVNPPVIANGSAYFALGDELWQVNASNVSQQIASFAIGASAYLRGSPAVAGNYVYTGGTSGIYYQLNASNVSQEIAEYDTGDSSFDGGIDCSPTISNGYFYGTSGVYFYQLDANNISKIIVEHNESNIFSEVSPIVYEGSVYLANDNGNLTQYNATDISQVINAARIGTGVIYSPASYSNGNIYLPVWSGLVVQFNASNISQQITNYSTGAGYNIDGGAAIAGDSLFACNVVSHELIQLNASNVSQFISKTQSVTCRDPVISGGYIYAENNLNNKTVKIGTSAYTAIGPSLNFTNPTPANGSSTKSGTIGVNVSIVNLVDLVNLTYNWNGTNTTMYDSSLVAMYNFENNSVLGENGTYVVDMSGNGNNASCSGSTCPVFNAVGKYGGGYNFSSGSSTHLDVLYTSNFNFGSSDFAVEFWTYVNSLGADNYILTVDDAAAGQPGWSEATFEVSPTGVLESGSHYGGSMHWITSPTGVISAGNWYNIILTRTGTVSTLYVNGIVNGTDTGLSTTALTNAATYGIIIGARAGPTTYWNGIVDELRIYNGKGLSASEVQQHYMSNLAKYNATQWNLYVNQAKNATTALDYGKYTYQAFATDSSGNMNSSELRNFESKSDATAPGISFASPTPANATRTTNRTQIINVSIIDQNDLANLTYNWNGTNTTMYDNSLVLMYNFENISSLGENGTYVVDMSRYGNNGSAKGNLDINSTNGKYGGGVYLDGTGDYINLGQDASLRPTNFTLTAWVKKNRNGARESIFNNGNDQVTNEWGFYAYLEDSNNHLYGRIADCTDQTDYDSGFSITDTAWHFVAYTYSGTTLNIFVDGNNKSFTSTRTLCFTSPTDVYIGRHYGVTTQDYSGYIDEPRMWNRSLSADEIQQQYMSNLQKYNSTQWYLYVNQSKNVTALLDYGKYTYQVFGADGAGNTNLTDLRSLEVDSDLISPGISFVSPTSANATRTTNRTNVINVSIIDQGDLSNLTYNWNGTNTTMYDNSLVLMYNFENNSGLGENGTYVRDMSLYGNNGTLGGSTYNLVSDGKFGSALNKSTEDYLDTNLKGVSMYNFAISYWAKNEVIDKYEWDTNVNKRFGCILGDATTMEYYVVDTFYTISHAALDTNWNLYTHVVSNGVIYFYINGKLAGTADVSSKIGSSDIFNGDFHFGSRYALESSSWIGTTGKYDELRIWNRSLSASEIQQQYLSNLARYNATQWYLYVNQSKNATDVLDYGKYTYQAFGADGAGNTNLTDLRSLEVDSDLTSPGISFASPTPANATRTTNRTQIINVSIVDQGDLANLTYNWNGTNTTMYDSSLVLMMNFENISALGENGTYVVDMSGKGNNASCSGSTCPSLIPGKYGSAYKFAGGNSLGSIIQVNHATGTTYSVWINTSATSTKYFFGEMSNTVGTQGYVNVDGTVTWLIYNSGGGSTAVTTIGTVNNNVWHHMAFSWDGTTGANGIKIYIDGKLDNQGTSGTTFGLSQCNLIIGDTRSTGCAARGSGEDFVGSLDEFRVYNRTLSASEIQQQYLSNLARYNATQWYLYVNQSKNATTVLDYGKYTYQAFGADGAGNTNLTDLRSLEVYDGTPPFLNFTSPTPANATRTTNRTNVINVSIIDQGDLSNLTYNWNGTNTTMYDNSLVLMYNFENISSLGENGTYVVDMSRYGRNATLLGTTSQVTLLSGGRYGMALNLSGGYTRTDNVDAFKILNAITISAWIKTPVGVDDYIVTKGNDAFYFGLGPAGTTANKLSCYLNGVSAAWTQGTTSLNDNAWHHTICTWNGTDVMLYVDGKKEADAIRSGTITTGVDYIYVGYRTAVFYGMIDEFRLYNRSISDAEAYQLYASNLVKYNATQWYLYVNQSKNATDVLDYGKYTYQAFGADGAGNTNLTDLRSLEVDSDLTSPGISFASPTPPNATRTTNRTNIINVSIIDQGDLGNLTYNWNGTNTTIYDSSLVAMYNFENISSLGENGTHVVDMSGKGNNASCSGSTCPVFNAVGKYGGGYNFSSGSSTHLDVPYTSNFNFGSSDFAVEFWTYVNSIGADNYILTVNDLGDGNAGWAQATFEVSPTGILYSGSHYGGSMHWITSPAGIISVGNWYHIILTRTGSVSTLYVNGIVEGTDTGLSTTALTNTGSYGLFIGERQGGTYWNGVVDELRVYNGKGLSASDVQQQYMSNLMKYNSTQWYLYVNQSKNATVVLDYGNYTYQAFASDTSGNTNSTELRNLEVVNDTTPPTITNVISMNVSGVSGGSVPRGTNVTINATVSDTFGIDKVWVKIWDGLAFVSNIIYQGFMTLVGGIWTITIPTNMSWPIGQLNYTVYANDTSGNVWNVTGNFTVFDATAPMLNFTSPTPVNATRTTNRTNVINVSIIDQGDLANLTYNWNGTNTTMYDNSLVLMYNFENISSLGENGTYVRDMSQYGNNGSAKGGATINLSGKYGNAMNFNGINGYVNVSNINQINGASQLTVGAWVKMNTIVSCDPGQCSPDIVTKYNEQTNGFLLAYYSTPANGFSAYVMNGGWTNGHTGTSGYNSNQWYYVVFTYDGSGSANADKLKIYVDGINQSLTFSGTIPSTIGSNSFPVQIGSYPIATSLEDFNGLIDEVRIWNRSLSAAEIQQQYMSNLMKYNATQWYLYVNQSKNSTAVLDYGNYTYQAFGADASGNANSTDLRSMEVYDGTPPFLNFTSPTPANATRTTNRTNIINVSIVDQGDLSNLTYNWNGTNTTMYDSSLLAMYNFENNSGLGENGTYVVDMSKYGNNGSLKGVVYNSTGKYGRAYQFDGSSGYMDAGNAVDLNPSSEITITAWVKFNAFQPSGFQYDIVAAKETGGVYQYYIGTRSNINPQNAVFDFGNGDGSTEIQLPTALQTGVWYFIAGTSKLGGSQTYYVNGVQQTNTASGSSITTSGNLKLGHAESAGFGTNYLNGMIDEVRIWNRSLSAAEVQQQYLSNLARYNATQWYLYVNQSKNSTAVLDYGKYTYQAFGADASGNANSTEMRSLEVYDGTPPFLNFTSPTPANATRTTNRTNVINVSIIDQGDLANLTYNWNGTNTTLYDSSLMAMYNFDSYTKLNDTSEYGNNGTTYGDAAYTASGKYGGAYTFDGSGDYISVGSGSSLYPTGAVSVAGWLKNNNDNSGMYVSSWWGSGWRGYNLGSYNTNYAQFYTGCSGDSDGSVATSTTSIVDNNWHYLVGVYNGTTNLIYVDGVLENTAVVGCPALDYGSNSCSIVTLGSYCGHDSYYLTGALDEVRIWNRSLSASEIQQQYLSNLARYNATQWYLYVNQSKNATVALDYGNYTYQAIGVDTNGNTNLTDLRSMEVVNDTTGPTITNVVTTNITGTTGGRVPIGTNVTINATVSDTFGLDKVWVKIWDGVAFISNIIYQGFMTLVGGIWTISIPTNVSWPLGQINYTVYANDTFGNVENITGNFTTFDATAPLLTIILPLNQTYTIPRVDFNVTANENLSFCKFSIDNWATNYTMTAYNSTYFNYTKSSIVDGSYTAKFWCNDTSGNVNATESVAFSTSSCNLNVTSSTTLTYDILNCSNNFIIRLAMPNIIFDCAGHTIESMANYSIYSNSSNVTIKNCNVLLDGANSTQGIFVNHTNSNTIEGNRVNVSSDYFIEVDYSNYTVLDSNNVTGGVPAGIQRHFYGITLRNSNWANITNNNVTVTENYALYEDALSYYSIITNNSFSSQQRFEPGPNATIFNNNIYCSGAYCFEPAGNSLIYDNIISGGTWPLNLFTSGNRLVNNNISGTHLGSPLENLASPNYLIYNNSYGEVMWAFTNISMPETGTISLGTAINITNNSIIVNSGTYYSLNKSANVTLRGIGNRGFNNPAILYNGLTVCNAYTNPSCTAFTSLTADEVVFNVSGWSNYSIGNNTYTTAPLLTIRSPLNQTYATSMLEFNVTADKNLGFCKFSINNWATNYTMTAMNTSYYNYTNSSVPDGSYTAKFSCNDTYGNINATESVTFSVDVTAPVFGIMSPENITYNTKTIILDVSANGAVDSWWYSSDSGAHNQTFSPRTTYTWQEGTNTLWVWANDSYNNVAVARVIFAIDSIKPAITIQSPLNASYNKNILNLNWSSDSALNWATYSLNGAANVSFDVNTLKQTGEFTNDSSIANGYDLSVKGDYAFVISNDDSLTIINISDKTNPKQMGYFANSSSISNLWAVAVDENASYAYIPSYDTASLTVIDVSDKTNPRQVGSFVNDTSMHHADGAAVLGNYTYVASYGRDSLTIIDISNKTNPRQVGYLRNDTSMLGAYRVIARDNYAYVDAYDGNTVAIIDISDKTNPKQVGAYTNDTSLNLLYSIELAGEYIYTASYGSDIIAVIDISNKTNPKQVGAYLNDTSLAAPYAVSADGDYLYSISEGYWGIVKIDISDKTNPRQVGDFLNDSAVYPPSAIRIAGGYAYVLGGTIADVVVFNITQQFANTTINAAGGSNRLTACGFDLADNVNCTSVEFSVDTAIPGITISYPANITYNTNVSALNFSASDINLDSCWYSTNGETTNTTTSCSANLTGLTSTEGSNIWVIGINDTFGNKNSTFVTFSKDTIKPQLTISFPANTTYNTNVSALNFSASDINLDSCWYSTNGETTKLDTAGLIKTASTTYSTYVEDNAFDGNNETYWWSDGVTTGNWLEIDFGAGNEKQVTKISLSHDDAVSITGNVEGSNDDSAWTILTTFTHPTKNTMYNTTFSNSNSYRYYRLNFTNSTPSNNWIKIREWELYTFSINVISCASNITGLTSTEGSNTWVIGVNDTFGNVNSSSVTFYKDTIVPLITIISPQNRTYNRDNLYEIDLNVSSNENLSYCNETTAGGGDSLGVHNFTMTAVNSTYWIIGPLGLTFASPNYYTVAFLCVDLAGNVNATERVTFYLDGNNPAINFTNPTTASGNYNNATTSIVVNISASDIGSGISNVSYLLHDISGVVGDIVNVWTSPPYFVNLSYLPAGNYTLNATAYDQVGNINWTETRYINLSVPVILSIMNESSEGNLSEWRMFRRWLNHTAWDGISYGTVPGLNVSHYTTGNVVDSSPAVANGFVYIGSYDKQVYQLNASDISQKIANFTMGAATSSSPAVAYGFVYVGSQDDQVYQLNASNISQKIANFTTGSYVSSSPAVAYGFVYVGSQDDQVYQLNASNISQKIANFTTGDVILSSSPAVAGGYVYIGSLDQNLYQLNASNISQEIAQYNANNVVSSPAVAGGYVYLGIGDYQVYQLNANNVSQKVASYMTGGSLISSPAVANGFVYIGCYDKQVYQLNASNVSQKIANFTTGAATSSSPAVANGFVYIGSNDKQIYQLNASNVSQKISNFTTGGIVVSSPAFANGYIYVGSYDKNVYQLNATNISLGALSADKYPTFSDYWDNNASLVGSGTALFNVTMLDTNGSVWLGINGVNVTATNLTASAHNIYSASYSVTSSGTYNYIWYAYGNGTSHLANNSGVRQYYVNKTAPEITPPVLAIVNPKNISYNNAGIDFNVTADKNLSMCKITLDNWATNYTMIASNASDFNYNNDSMPEGSYTAKFWCNDTYNNINASASVIFGIDRTNPLVTINAPINMTYTAYPIGVNISLSESGTCEYSIDNGQSNDTMTASGDKKEFTANIGRLANGFYVLNAFCRDDAGNRNETESAIFAISVSNVAPPSGGGGGGAGGSSFALPLRLLVIPPSFDVTLLAGDSKTYPIQVTNAANIPMHFDILVVGDDITGVVQTENSIDLSPGQTKTLMINVKVGDKGLLTGTIMFRTRNYQASMPVVVNIKSKNFLFDSAITVLDETKFVEAGTNVKAQVDLLQVEPKENVDVLVTYVIKDFSGNIYSQESETLSVLDEKSYTKEFSTIGLPVGKYIIGLEIMYPGAFATSSSQFEVVNLKEQKANALKIMVIALGILLILAILYWALRRMPKAKAQNKQISKV